MSYTGVLCALLIALSLVALGCRERVGSEPTLRVVDLSPRLYARRKRGRRTGRLHRCISECSASVRRSMWRPARAGTRPAGRSPVDAVQRRLLPNCCPDGSRLDAARRDAHRNALHHGRRNVPPPCWKRDQQRRNSIGREIQRIRDHVAHSRSRGRRGLTYAAVDERLLVLLYECSASGILQAIIASASRTALAAELKSVRGTTRLGR